MENYKFDDGKRERKAISLMMGKLEVIKNLFGDDN